MLLLKIAPPLFLQAASGIPSLAEVTIFIKIFDLVALTSYAARAQRQALRFGGPYSERATRLSKLGFSLACILFFKIEDFNKQACCCHCKAQA